MFEMRVAEIARLVESKKIAASKETVQAVITRLIEIDSSAEAAAEHLRERDRDQPDLEPRLRASRRAGAETMSRTGKIR